MARRAGVAAGAGLWPGDAEEACDSVRLDVDRQDVAVVLLVRDEGLAAWLHEGVVVEDEPASLRPVRRRGEAPEGPPGRVDEEDAVVAAIGDEKSALQWARERDDPVRIRLGARGRRLGRAVVSRPVDEGTDERDRHEHGETDGEPQSHLVTVAVRA